MKTFVIFGIVVLAGNLFAAPSARVKCRGDLTVREGFGMTKGSTDIFMDRRDPKKNEMDIIYKPVSTNIGDCLAIRLLDQTLLGAHLCLGKDRIKIVDLRPKGLRSKVEKAALLDVEDSDTLFTATTHSDYAEKTFVLEPGKFELTLFDKVPEKEWTGGNPPPLHREVMRNGKTVSGKITCEVNYL